MAKQTTTKVSKIPPTPAPNLGAKQVKDKVPKDERKQFFIAPYVLESGKLRIRTMLGKQGQNSHTPLESRDEAIAEAQSYLSGIGGGHSYPITGILVFESVQVIKPKKIEIEIEQLDPK